MKIRSGFVSNSSSSSFVIIGRYINTKELLNGEYDSENNVVMLKGGWGCEGEMLFELTKDMIEEIRKTVAEGKTFDKFDMMEVFACGEEFSFETKDIPEKVSVYCTEVDHWMPDVSEFVEHYINGDGIEY